MTKNPKIKIFHVDPKILSSFVKFLNLRQVKLCHCIKPRRYVNIFGGTNPGEKYSTFFLPGMSQPDKIKKFSFPGHTGK